MKNIILAPWLTNGIPAHILVSATEIEMQHPWTVYLRYDFVSGVGPNLNAIPKHVWGRGHPNESLLRVPRLVFFVDVTGCRPIQQEHRQGAPRSHHTIETIAHCDHTSYWRGPNGEPFILTEPYAFGVGELQAEIAQRNLTGILLPAPGIYAGCNNSTRSLLMGLPEHQETLRHISTQLNGSEWPRIGPIEEMDWVSALQLSKRLNAERNKSEGVRS